MLASRRKMLIENRYGRCGLQHRRHMQSAYHPCVEIHKRLNRSGFDFYHSRKKNGAVFRLRDSAVSDSRSFACRTISRKSPLQRSLAVSMRFAFQNQHASDSPAPSTRDEFPKDHAQIAGPSRNRRLPPARFTPIWLRATFYSVKPKLIQQSRISAAPGRRTSWRKVGFVRHVLLTRRSRCPKPKPSANGCGVTPSRCASPSYVPALACVATPPNPFRWEPGNGRPPYRTGSSADDFRPTIMQIRNDWLTSCAS